jgi:hypothetical protein
LEASIHNVIFKQNDGLQFLIAVNGDFASQLEADLSIDALDFDPSKGEVETTVWEERVVVPSGRKLNVLAKVLLDDVRRRVHCREIQYEVKLKPSGSLTERGSSFRSSRMVSTFDGLPSRTILEGEFKRKKTIAYREYMRETR